MLLAEKAMLGASTGLQSTSGQSTPSYFIPKEQIDFWLYLALPSAGFQNTDAGVPGLNRDFAYSRQLTSPPVRLRRLFNEAVEPMFSQRTTLENYNQKLAQARDLLLPRLMNGEIAV